MKAVRPFMDKHILAVEQNYETHHLRFLNLHWIDRIEQAKEERAVKLLFSLQSKASGKKWALLVFRGNGKLLEAN